jgi:hypothetical protein
VKPLRLLAIAPLAVLLTLAVPAQARDRTPPKFEGLKSATTCIPGPVGGNEVKTPYHLEWNAATDDVTPQNKIVYRVYQATKPGGENFAKPTYTTAPGATSFNTPKLSSLHTYYFVVRARDRAGNEDKNTVEREGQNLCV